MTEREKISIVWFKRDLRLQDNEAIQNAVAKGRRILLLYPFERESQVRFTKGFGRTLVRLCFFMVMAHTVRAWTRISALYD